MLSERDDIAESIGSLKQTLERIRDMATDLKSQCGHAPTRLDVTIPDELFDAFLTMSASRDSTYSHPFRPEFVRQYAGDVEVIFHRPPKRPRSATDGFGR